MRRELHNLREILLAAERSSRGGAAELCFQSSARKQTIGRLGVQMGRVCWATARGQQRSLTDLVAAEAHCERAVLDELFQSSRQSGEPFGELLIRHGIMTPDAIRMALLGQTLGALQALAASWDADTDEVAPRSSPGVAYDQSFTSSALGLLERCAGQWLTSPALSSFASDRGGMGAEVGGALLFACDGARPPSPIASAGSASELDLETAVAVGRCAQSLVRAPALQVAGVQAFAVVAHDEGEGILARVTELGLEAYLVADRAQCVSALATVWAERHASTRSVHG